MGTCRKIISNLEEIVARFHEFSIKDHLPNPHKADILSDMKTVTLRSLRRNANLLNSAAEGEELLVTRRGKPYVRIVSASQLGSFVGAGRHLGLKTLVSPTPIPKAEWQGLV